MKVSFLSQANFFAIPHVDSKIAAHFKSGQKWLKNNYLTFLRRFRLNHGHTYTHTHTHTYTHTFTHTYTHTCTHSYTHTHIHTYTHTHIYIYTHAHTHCIFQSPSLKYSVQSFLRRTSWLCRRWLDLPEDEFQLSNLSFQLLHLRRLKKVDTFLERRNLFLNRNCLFDNSFLPLNFVPNFNNSFGCEEVTRRFD